MLVNSQTRIMYDELPCVDRILQLLNDILLVRAFNLLELEFELYEKLIYIYRDPAYLIKVTMNNISSNKSNKDRNNKAIKQIPNDNKENFNNAKITKQNKKVTIKE